MSRFNSLGFRPGRRFRFGRRFYPAHQLGHGRHHNLVEYGPQGPGQDPHRSVEKGVLAVTNVDFNVAVNAHLHHTDRYEITEDREVYGRTYPAQLVVRRGQPFNINITFDRPFDREKDDIKLIFSIGEEASETKGTLVRLLLSDEDKKGAWGAKILRQSGNDLSVNIFTPPNAVVAKWDFKFDAIVKKGEEQKVFRYTHQHPIYILFNPWCPDDQVYMDDELSREEYVLNDRGRVYQGTPEKIHSKPWNFGQFEDFMLDCCMYLLDKSELKARTRRNPVQVVRKISALANDVDDNGVLVGNWSGDYAGGTSPTYWNGSVAILEEYWNNREPVKFGQCWVFSGVVTTICRCLGIPARSVTNFCSAHDCDETITIDCFWTPEGQPLHELNDDSIWNFHVWNDVWMMRPDLPPGFGGWQAIDATPQEASDGVYCAGPASVEAIKNGLVNMPYDGAFIFAEVNADRVHWIEKPDGTWTNTKETHCVGKYISTKNPVSNERIDVTKAYKFAEGTEQERTATIRAISSGSSRDDIYDEHIKQMVFEFVEKEDIMIGQPFNVTLKITNQATEARKCDVTLTATSVHYTGCPAAMIKTDKTENLAILAGASKEIKMKVKSQDYMDKLVDKYCIQISCRVWSKETNEYHFETNSFQLTTPKLNLKAPQYVNVGEEYEVVLSFKNPLPTPLTNCQFSVEGASLQKQMVIKHENVAAHTEAKAHFKLTARRAGYREIIGEFDSKEIDDVTAEAEITVSKQR